MTTTVTAVAFSGSTTFAATTNSTITQSLTIAGFDPGDVIEDVNVLIGDGKAGSPGITHSGVGDLQIRLVYDNGTAGDLTDDITVILVDGIGTANEADENSRSDANDLDV